jgi:uncharacterized membrane protein YkoI
MLSALLLLAVSAADAEPQRRSDQMSAWAARKEGRAVPLREIERRVIPQVPGGEYLGADYDEGEAVYTLKFLREGRVIWVEVDGATGQVVGRSGR